MTSRTRNLLIFLIVITLLTITFYVLLFKQDHEIHISTQPASDFGLPRQEDIYMPNALTAIPNTSYLYLDFVSQNRHDVIVVDLDKRQKIFHLWKNEQHGKNPFGNSKSKFFNIFISPIQKWRNNFGIRIDQMQAILMSSQSKKPLILLDNKVYGPGRSIDLSLKLFDLKGNYSELPNMGQINAIPGTNRLLEIKPMKRPNMAKMDFFQTEHRIENGKLIKGPEWRILNSHTPIVEQYLTHLSPTQNLFYLSKEQSGLLQTSLVELAAVYNGTTSNIQSIVNMASDSKEPVYFMITEKNDEQNRIQILECVLEPGLENKITPHFKWIGKNIVKTTEMPETISQDRRHIFLFKLNEYPDERVERFTLSRTLNPDGSLGEFETELKSLKHDPGYPIRFAEYQPYEDCMLFYRDEALWTMNFDGTNEEKIFPRETP